MSNKKRIAVIGAGHSALVCACYLAKAGHDVSMFEQRVCLSSPTAQQIAKTESYGIEN